MAKKKQEIKEPAFLLNHNLPNVFVDSMRISARSDNVAFIGFFTDMPDGRYEQARILTHTDKLKVFIDVICKHINHYPEKPVDDTQENQKEEKKK